MMGKNIARYWIRNIKTSRLLKKAISKWKLFGFLGGIILLSGALVSACQPLAAPTIAPSVTATKKITATSTHTPQPTPTATATLQPTWWIEKQKLDGVKIVFLHPWSGKLANELDLLVKSFNQTNEWGIEVSAQGLGSAQQVFQRSETGMSIGSGPQVIVAPIEELAYWHTKGDLLALNGFLNDATYGMDSTVQSDFFAPFWAQDMVGDEQLGIPFNRDFQFFLYNQSWAKELGFKSDPANLDQMRMQLCSAAQSLLDDNSYENNGTGGWIINRNEYVLLSWMRSFGISDFPTSEEAYLFDQQGTLQTAMYLKGLLDGNCVWVSRNPSPYDYFANRQALMISADLNDLAQFTTAMKISGSSDEWEIIPYRQQNGQAVVISQGSSYGIFRSSKAQELASWLFINWMSQPVQQQKLAAISADLPVLTSLINELPAQRGKEWQQVLALLDSIQPSPRTSEWRVARFVLPDAFYQVTQGIASQEQYPQLFTMLDETIASLVQQPPFTGW